MCTLVIMQVDRLGMVEDDWPCEQARCPLTLSIRASAAGMCACVGGGRRDEGGPSWRDAFPDDAWLPALQVYLDERKVQKQLVMNKRSLGNPTPAHGCCNVGSADGPMSGPPRIERTSVSLISADPLSGGLGSAGPLSNSASSRCCVPAHAALLLVRACAAVPVAALGRNGIGSAGLYTYLLHATPCCLPSLAPILKVGLRGYSGRSR